MIFHVVVDGVMEGALGLGLDVVDTASRLLRAGKAPAPRRLETIEQRVVSDDGRPVRSVQGRRLSVDGALRLATIRRDDVLVLPGVFATKDSSIDRVLAQADVQRVVAVLRGAVKKGARVAASCSATFFLAAAGLLDGGRATTTWWLAPFFSRRFPRVELCADRMVVEHRGTLTAGSAFAHADLMLAVVARLAGPSLANLAASYLLLDARASQSRYMVMDHLRTFDPVLQRLEEFVQANLGRQVTLHELARTASTSPRTLARRLEASVGESPQRFVQRVRVAHAVHLLETTNQPVEEIAARVGYADSTAFRRVFRRYTGQSPRARRTTQAERLAAHGGARRPVATTRATGSR